MEPKDRLIRDEEKEEKAVTEIICVVDRSGSMQLIIDDAVGGFNSLLADQRALPDEAYLTLYTFDDKCEIVFESVPIREMKDITRETIKPRGSTALWDAIGQTLADSIARVRHRKVIVVILTDGEENASVKYVADAVHELVKECKKSGWEFLFLGANMDAFAVGKTVGFDVGQTVVYEATSRGIQDAYDIASTTMSSLRSRS
jgi:Mg-chelatase subunit ChlD